MNSYLLKYWQKIKRSIASHRLAIIVMLAVSFVYGMPQIVARQALGPLYQGIPYVVNDSEGEYLGRIQEIFDGHYSVSSPVFFEYKDSVSLIPPTGEFIFYALPKYLTGLSIGSVIFLDAFILPALIFLFLYALIYSISINKDDRSKISAIAGALLVTLGAGIIDYHGFFCCLLHGGNSQALLWLSRLVNPVTGMFFLSLLLLLLWRVFVKEPRWPIIISSLIILSVMSGYIFSFALGLTIASLLALYFLICKNWKHALKLAVISLGALLLNGIYLASALSTVTGFSVTTDPLKSGMFFTHVPTLNIFSLLVLIICLAFFFVIHRKNGSIARSDLGNRWWFFILAIAFACLIVYIQQILTGIAVWPQHFTQYTVPLGMIVAVVILENVIRPRWSWLWTTVVALMLFVSSVCGIRSLLSVSATIPQYADQQTFAPVFNWLNNNAAKDCVVYVSSDYANEINRFIAAFTSCNVYHSFHVYNGVPEDRIMHNFLVNMRLRGVKSADVAKHFKENWFWTQSYFFRDWGDIFCCSDRWLAQIKDPREIAAYFDTVEKQVDTQYKEYLKGDLLAELEKYRLDYFVVDIEKQPQVNPRNFSFLKKQAQYGRFIIYSVAH